MRKERVSKQATNRERKAARKSEKETNEKQLEAKKQQRKERTKQWKRVHSLCVLSLKQTTTHLVDECM